MKNLTDFREKLETGVDPRLSSTVVGKTSCACTVVAKMKKIIISSNFSLKLLLTVI